MDTLPWISIVSRWLHILPAALAVGSTIFIRFALVPALAESASDERSRLHDRLRTHWAKFIHLSILLLLASGFYNLFVVIGMKNREPIYHALFGVKFLLALAVFGIASVIVGRSSAGARFREQARFWSTINLSLLVAIVLISGVMRFIPPKVVAPPTTPPAVSAADESGS